MKNVKIKSMNCAINDKILYLISSEFNMIYELNLITNKIELFENLPEEKFIQSNLYGNIIFSSGKLFLVPCCAEKIWIYNIKQNIWNAVEIPDTETNKQYKFYGAFLYEEYIYMLGHYYPGIIRLDINTYNVVKININLQSKEISNYKEGYFNWDYVIKENWLYAPIVNSNRILKLNLQTEEYQLIVVGSSNNRYSGIVWDGKYFWLPPRRNTPFVKWDGERYIKEYCLPKEFEREQFYFCGAYLIKNKVVFSGFTKYTLEFMIDNPERALVLNRRNNFYKQISDNMVIVQEEGGNLYIQEGINPEKEIVCLIDESKFKKIINDKIFQAENFKELEIIMENSFIFLENWIMHIDTKRNSSTLCDNVGKKIYDCI